MKTEGATNMEKKYIEEASVTIEEIKDNSIKMKIEFDNPSLISMADQSVQDRLILGIDQSQIVG